MITFEKFYKSFTLKIEPYYLYEKTQYYPDRIPHSAKSTYEGVGGKTLQEATAIAEASHGAVSKDQEEFTEIQDRVRKREQRNRLSKLIKPKEEVGLYLWAKKNKLLMDNEEFDLKWNEQGNKGETENEVYYDENTHSWIKRNNLIYHSTYLEFFHRVALHNHMFPEAPLNLIGFVVNDNHLWPVISQPHVEADRGASRAEVMKHMKTLGFTNLKGTDDYFNSETGIKVEDLHDENVLVAPDGKLYIVDPVIYLDDEGKKHRLAAYTELG